VTLFQSFIIFTGREVHHNLNLQEKNRERMSLALNTAPLSTARTLPAAMASIHGHHDNLLSPTTTGFVAQLGAR
jgi:hypothetical protein